MELVRGIDYKLSNLNYKDVGGLVSQTTKKSPNQPINLGAAMIPHHTSATEDLLNWKFFDNVAEIRTLRSVFTLEDERPQFDSEMPKIVEFPDRQLWDSLVESFQAHLNFWYPAMSWEHLTRLYKAVNYKEIDKTPETCLIFLISALGGACIATERYYVEDHYDYSIAKTFDELSREYFIIAYNMLPVVMAGDSLSCMLSLFYMAYVIIVLIQSTTANQNIHDVHQAATSGCRADEFRSS